MAPVLQLSHLHSSLLYFWSIIKFIYTSIIPLRTLNKVLTSSTDLLVPRSLGEDLGTEENFNTGEDDVKADIGEKPALEALVMNLGSFKEGMKG